MTSGGAGGRARGLSLEQVRWHILREDQHRAGVATRAGTVLSTNALVIAGTALIFSTRGGAKPTLLAMSATLGTLVFVAASVVFAAVALTSPRILFTPKKGWVHDWDSIATDAAYLYSYPFYSVRWPSFEEFHTVVANASPEQQLRGAITELWIGASIDHYRFSKLHAAVRCLIVAIGFLLVTVGLITLPY